MHTCAITGILVFYHSMLCACTLFIRRIMSDHIYTEAACESEMNYYVIEEDEDKNSCVSVQNIQWLHVQSEWILIASLSFLTFTVLNWQSWGLLHIKVSVFGIWRGCRLYTKLKYTQMFIQAILVAGRTNLWLCFVTFLYWTRGLNP